jgi:hypothetical protein
LELYLAQDSRLLAFAIAVALAATLLSGLTPALRTSQMERAAREPFALRRWLAGEFAFTFVLLVSAALFVRSLARASQADPGFDVKHVLTAEVNLEERRYFDRAMNEIRRLPGVRSVSGAAVIPLGIEHWVMSMKARDRIIQRVHVNSVTPGYFDTMRIALLRGRDFMASDRDGAMPVAVVNETFARKYLNDRGIDGEVLIPHRPDLPGGAPLYSRVRVVGVVACVYPPQLQQRTLSPILQSSSALVTGRDFSITWCTSVKIAVVAPIPSASVIIAVAVKPGAFRSCGSASRKSAVISPSIRSITCKPHSHLIRITWLEVRSKSQR